MGSNKGTNDLFQKIFHILILLNEFMGDFNFFLYFGLYFLIFHIG